MNVCGGCGEDFVGVSLFDDHRVGKHDVDWPKHENGRRCLSIEEMSGRGWEPNERGAWRDPAAAERVRAAFAGRSASG